MLDACRSCFARCDGLIGAAAPCDYRPQEMARQKLRKTGGPRVLDLVETPDIIATLAREKTAQWLVAFALETEDRHLRAMQKLERKQCDLIVLNGPAAIRAARHPRGDHRSLRQRRGPVRRQQAGRRPRNLPRPGGEAYPSSPLSRREREGVRGSWRRFCQPGLPRFCQAGFPNAAGSTLQSRCRFWSGRFAMASISRARFIGLFRRRRSSARRLRRVPQTPAPLSAAFTRLPQQ